jgi:hypothetical protein
MKRHFKVFLFIAILSLIVIFSNTISREIIEFYNESVSGASVPPPAQIYYQMVSR